MRSAALHLENVRYGCPPANMSLACAPPTLLLTQTTLRPRTQFAPPAPPYTHAYPAVPHMHTRAHMHATGSKGHCWRGSPCRRPALLLAGTRAAPTAFATCEYGTAEARRSPDAGGSPIYSTFGDFARREGRRGAGGSSTVRLKHRSTCSAGSVLVLDQGFSARQDPMDVDMPQEHGGHAWLNLRWSAPRARWEVDHLPQELLQAWPFAHTEHKCARATLALAGHGTQSANPARALPASMQLPLAAALPVGWEVAVLLCLVPVRARCAWKSL